MSSIYIDINEYMDLLQTERQSHLNLTEDCIEIGGHSREFRGLLAFYLKTTIPKGMKVHLCHACHNARCSNPRHLYWGTARENSKDSFTNGRISVFDATVRKYGREKTLEMYSIGLNKGRLIREVSEAVC